MDNTLKFLEKENIVKVVVQNDIFDVFTATKVCLRFDLATSKLLREISFDKEGFGESITNVKYYEQKDAYVISSTKNFLIGDFVYGFRLIEKSMTCLDIRKESMACATDAGLEIYTYPELISLLQLNLEGIYDLCFVNDDRELFIVTKHGNFVLKIESMLLKPLEKLPNTYRKLRYKNDFIIGIKEDSIDFIEEDILEVSNDYPKMEIPNETLTAVKLCDDEAYVIMGGSLGSVEIFNVQTHELFYKGKMVDGCAIETIYMDMEYQLVLIYTKEKGIELHPFVEFV